VPAGVTTDQNLMVSHFEGPEKKLEIHLAGPLSDLRSNRDGRRDRVVRASGATIISRIRGRHMDACLLSESNLFVWDDRILMITRGRTHLIRALPEILGLVTMEMVGALFYERKNALYPMEQPSGCPAGSDGPERVVRRHRENPRNRKAGSHSPLSNIALRRLKET
jgi:hypothetical protein